MPLKKASLWLIRLSKDPTTKEIFRALITIEGERSVRNKIFMPIADQGEIAPLFSENGAELCWQP